MQHLFVIADSCIDDALLKLPNTPAHMSGLSYSVDKKNYEKYTRNGRIKRFLWQIKHLSKIKLRCDIAKTFLEGNY